MREITIPQHVISNDDFNALRKYFKSCRDYSALVENTDAYDATIAAAKKLADITPGQILSIRSAVLKNKIITRFNIISAYINQIVYEYNAGKNIIELANLYDFSPLHLFRAIMEQSGVAVGALYRQERQPEDVLSGRDLEQFKMAFKADLASSDRERLTFERAAENERKFVEYFKSLGVSLKTQDDLTEEQMLAHGRAISTPDILFTEAVKINNVGVHWLDFKNYVGTPIGFLRKSNAKQAKRYNALYGNGAMCYANGYVESYQIPNTLVLDVSEIMAKII